MKLLSSYLKEMKIAFRGFYFYIEIFIATILLIILFTAIKENSGIKTKEYLFYDMPEVVYNSMVEEDIKQGKLIKLPDTELKLKPAAFDVLNRDTGKTTSYTFEDQKTVTAKTMEQVDKDTGKVKKILYRLDNEEDTLRLSRSTGNVGASITMSDQGEFSYRYMIQGYETERYSNLLYMIHTLPSDIMEAEFNKQIVREIGSGQRLNNRESVVPIFVVFSGSLMGIFIVMSYVFLDKDQGVIRAFAVTPSAVWTYLLSKILVIITTVVISSSIITIPVMRLKPNYFLFYMFLIVTTFAFSTFGLLIASFFDSISKSFGILYVVMIALMLPAFPYYIGSFDPLWLRFFPTYPALEGFRGILLGQANVPYVMAYGSLFLVGGALILFLANRRFKKTLTV